MPQYVDREDDVLCYFTSEEEARRDRDAFYPAPRGEAAVRAWVASLGQSYSEGEIRAEIAADAAARPPIRRSEKRPGMWYYSSSR